MAKGYVQRVGIDFDEVFAPVARLESVWMMVALVAHERSTVHHMDVKSAFLIRTLKEEVYVRQPLASSLPTARGRCCASARCCMTYFRRRGPRMPSLIAQCCHLVSRGAAMSMASTPRAEAMIGSSSTFILMT
jgi:hypothetical protein